MTNGTSVKPDSKLIDAVSRQALSRASLAVASVMASALCIVTGALGKVAYDSVQRQRQADLDALTSQNLFIGSRIDSLSVSICNILSDFKEVRNEVERRGSRLVTLETEHRQITSTLSRLEPELQRIREDLAAIKATLAELQRQTKRDGARIGPPGPDEQAGVRIPMLWHF